MIVCTRANIGASFVARGTQEIFSFALQHEDPGESPLSYSSPHPMAMVVRHYADMVCARGIPL